MNSSTEQIVLPDGRVPCILAVDDNPANLALISEYLKDSGFRMLVARDGESALEKAQHGQPDLILLDLLMPKIDGFEACRRLKADGNLKDIPIIFMTALTETADKMKGFQAGCVDYVTKPLQYEEVLARVKMHLALSLARKRLEIQNSLLQHEISVRTRVEKELQKSHAELEQRVRVRTAELARANAILRTQQDTSLDGILVVDSAGQIISFNQRFVDMWGIPSDIIASRMDARALQFVMGKLVEPEKFLEKVQYLYNHPDEKSHDEIVLTGGITFDRYSAPMIGHDGQSYGRVWYFTDITERKWAEKRILRLSRMYAVLSQVNQGIVRIHDPLELSRETCRIYAELGQFRLAWIGAVNHETQTIEVQAAWGQARDYVENMHLSLQENTPDALGPQVRAVVNGVCTVYSDAVRSSGKEPWRDSEGRHGFHSVASVPLWLRNKVVGVLSIYSDDPVFFNKEEINLIEEVGTDISFALESFAREAQRKRAEEERLEMERQLLHAQKLESLGVLAGGIAHDFNNLLMAMGGNMDLALEQLDPLSAARPPLEASMIAARSATSLVRQMLAFAGKGRYAFSELNLNALVLENNRILKAAISKNTNLNFQIGNEIPPILADVGQLQQVVMNLITNASEAMGEKPGTVTISTGVCTCDETCLERCCVGEKPSAGQFVYLEVSDAGCGMDAETRQRLFDPFFTTKATGRGLGMSAVLGIVRGHKGAIMVDSEVGRGTTFRVLFPALEPRLASVGADGRQKDEPLTPWTTFDHSRTILVVDDEEMIRNLCKEMLERIGFRVLTAEDGEAATRIFREHAGEIVCVLLDLTMPRMDGVATFHELLKINPAIKVLISSGYDAQESGLKFTGQRPSGFIQKPFNLNTIADSLERMLK
ncbi:MAG: response regulator [Lentisphaerota bacterium]